MILPIGPARDPEGAGVVPRVATVTPPPPSAPEAEPVPTLPTTALWRARHTRAALIAVAALTLITLAAVGIAGLDLTSVGSAMAGADRDVLLLAVLAYAAGQTLSGAMWVICQRTGGVRGLGLPTELGMHWVARAACEALPASLGEAVRVALVHRHPCGARAGAWRITGGLGAAKVIDTALTALVILAIALLVPVPGAAGAMHTTALVTLGALAAGALALRHGGVRRVAGRLGPRLRTAATLLGEGATVLRRPGPVLAAAGLGLAAIALRIASLAALLVALGAPAGAAMAVFAVITVAGILPLTPGGAGSREALLVPVLALAYGLPAGDALAFSVAVQAVALGTSLTLGAIALGALGGPAILRRPVPAVAPVPAPAPAG